MQVQSVFAQFEKFKICELSAFRKILVIPPKKDDYGVAGQTRGNHSERNGLVR